MHPSMKIKGADGFTPELIRDEVARGGRMVIYVYCVSLLVMTIKRPTSIHFVRAGQSTGVRGLPFTLVTLLFGWWGFPWGPIYSIECLYKNLRGGLDVTDDVLASILPAPKSGPGEIPTAPTLPPRPPAKSFTRRQLILGATAIIAVIVGIYASICVSAGEKLQVAVLNGLPDRATFTINGQAVAVGPCGYTLVTLPEGEFTVAAAANRPAETFRLETPFWSRPFNPSLAVINPDHAALFYRYHVIYKADNATGDDHGQPIDTTFYANQSHYLLPLPDYAFEEAPRSVTMPKGARFSSKTRIALAPVREPGDRIEFVAENLSDEAAQTFARNLTINQPDDERVLLAISRSLKPEVTLALLETRLDERPLRIEWHRYYQNLAERLHPELDLRAHYAALAAREPAEGAFHYLIGRIEPDSADARRSYERALAADHPCAHAHIGLGYLDNACGRFADALAHYDLAIQAGLKNETVLANRRDMLMALHRNDELLADIRLRRTANPRSLALAAEEIQAVLATTPKPDAVRKIEEAALARNSADATAEDKQSMRAYLDATAAYALGDETSFANEAGKLKGPVYAFQTAVSRRDHRSAQLALKSTPQPPANYLLILHLVARQAADEPAAQTYWTQAIEALGREGYTEKLVAEQLAGKAPLNAEWIHSASLPVLQKSLIFTSLGLQHPDQRETFHAWADQYNYSPDFPRLLIKSVIQPSAQVTRL